MAITFITKKTIISLLLSLIAIASQAQTVISGTVKTENGASLVGAFITLDGTSIRTLSDMDGNFSLQVPQQNIGNQITISYAGYLSRSIFALEGNYDIVLHEREVQIIEAMYVTTQKRLQRETEVPITLSIIDSAKIRQSNLYSIEDISYFSPGFNVTVPEAATVYYNIRGVSSDETESYGQSRISVFLDGVSISRTQQSYIEIYDMEQIEVAKGPQGTLYGRGEELGGVHFKRHKPTDKFGIDLGMQYGKYNQRKVIGAINTPAGKAFANRLSFCYDAHDGYIKNETGGRLNGKNTIALRNSSAFHFGSAADLNLVVDYQKDNHPGISYQGKTQLNNYGEITTDNNSPFTTANINNCDDRHMKRELGGAVAQLDCNISEHIKLSSISGVRAFSTDEAFDIDGTILNIVNGREKAKGYQVSEELRCNWNLPNGKLNGFFGASYFYEHNQHNYNFSGNLQYTFPLAVGKNIRNSLSNLPEQIVASIGLLINQWLDANQDMIKPFENLEIEGLGKIGDVMDQMISNFNTNISNSIKTRMSAQFGKWFDVMSWEKTPDFFNDTKNIIITSIKEEINQLLENDEYNVKFILDSWHLTGEGVVENIDIDSGLQQLIPISNVTISEQHAEDEVDYNRTNETSVFADFTWNFARNFYLTLGLRGNYEKSKTGYYSESLLAPMLGYILYTSTEGQTYWTEKDYKSWVGRAVVNWMITPMNNVYLSFSKGRRPGMNYFNYNPNDIITLNPETTYSYELGIKGNSKYGYLSYSAAFYYYDWKNFQTSVAGRGTTSTGALTYVSDDNGKAYGSGVELSTTYRFNQDVNIFADFAYNGGTFRDKDMNGNAQATADNMFAKTPRYTYDMGLNWQHELPGKKVIYFYPSFYAQSRMYFNVANNRELSQGSLLLLNGNAGIRWTKGRITYDIGVCGRNITNTHQLLDAGNAGEVIGIPTYEVAAPATYCLSLRLHIQ